MKKVFLIILFLSIIIAYFFHIEREWLADDEHAYTRRGVIVFQEYFSLHLNSPVWQQNMSYDTPKLAEMLFGAIITLVYRKNWNTLLTETYFTQNTSVTDNDHYEKGYWWMDNRYVSNPYEHVPEKFHKALSIIITGRYLTAVFGIGSLVLLFFICQMVFNYWVGVVAVVLLSINPVYYAHSRHVVGDVPFVFFELLSLYIFIVLIKKINILIYKGFNILTCVLGISLGALISTKLNGFVFLPFFLVCSLLLFITKKISRGHFFSLFIQVCIACVISLCVFYVLNPFVWSDPIHKMLFMYEWRLSETINLMKVYPDYSYPSVVDRPGMIFKEMLLPGGCCSTISTRIFYLDLLLILIGIATAVKKYFHSKLVLLFGFWFVWLFLSMIFYLPMSFDRYFLPMMPLIVIFESIGLYNLVQFIAYLVLKFKNNHYV